MLPRTWRSQPSGREGGVPWQMACQRARGRGGSDWRYRCIPFGVGVSVLTGMEGGVLTRCLAVRIVSRCTHGCEEQAIHYAQGHDASPSSVRLPSGGQSQSSD